MLALIVYIIAAVLFSFATGVVLYTCLDDEFPLPTVERLFGLLILLPVCISCIDIFVWSLMIQLAELGIL